MSLFDLERSYGINENDFKSWNLKRSIFSQVFLSDKNSVNMKQQGRFLPDKLLWRILADGAPTMPKEYDLAVAYLEGGAT
mgnify:CR=1 FL=1